MLKVILIVSILQFLYVSSEIIKHCPRNVTCKISWRSKRIAFQYIFCYLTFVICQIDTVHHRGQFNPINRMQMYVGQLIFFLQQLH